MRQWYTAFPQMVSRVGHHSELVYKILSQLIISIIQEYPRQALWGFAAVVQSKKIERKQRGDDILARIQVSVNFLDCSKASQAASE